MDQWTKEIENQAKSWHSLLAIGFATIMPFWIILDYLLVPNLWKEFSVVRTLCVFITFLIFILQKKLHISSKVTGYITSLVIYTGMGATTFNTGVAIETYKLAFLASYIGTSLFLFWDPPHSVITFMAGIIIYFGFSYSLGGNDLGYTFSNGGLLLITISIFSILIIVARVNFAKGEFLTRQKLRTTQKSLEKRTLEYKAILKDMKLKEEALQDELNIASEIQQGILPELPLQTKYFHAEGFYQPLQRVGGDFYDIAPMKKGGLAILIVDVSGHGIPAALLTIMAKIAFREAVLNDLNPAEILRHINNIAQQSIRTIEYMTAQCLYLPHDSDQAFFANGAHRPALLYSQKTGNVTELDSKGLILGQFTDKEFIVHESVIDFFPGDRICMLTDGFEETRDSHERIYGITRLLQSFQNHYNPSLRTHKNMMIRDWNTFFKNAPLQDDCSMVLVEKIKN